MSASAFMDVAPEWAWGSWSNGQANLYRYDNEVYNYYDIETYHDVIDHGNVQDRYEWIIGVRLSGKAHQGGPGDPPVNSSSNDGFPCEGPSSFYYSLRSDSLNPAP